MATLDIPNAFIQTKVPESKNGTRLVMRITGDEAQILQQVDPVYQNFVVYEKCKYCNEQEPVVYVVLHRAIYGMLQSAIWFYKQWQADLEGQGFVVNPYDPCTANKIVDGEQLTVVWHVDDAKVSHVNPNVVTDFIN